jgi:uncharacterized Zn finger protein
MAKFEIGFLSCSICDSDLELIGKLGAILQTKCSGCGMTSNDLKDNTDVKVYYSRDKAPASIPSG